jgi:putative selenate reductase
MARALGVPFGLKLTNTLEVRRPEGCGLGPSQAVVYMSGRALFPVVLRVASLLWDKLGPIPMAASGGLDASSVVMARNCGLGPLTLCTEMLRPGGYAALAACVEALSRGTVQRISLEEAAAAAGADPLRKNTLQRSLPKVDRLLEAFDCNAAPCSLSCPAGQEAPRYLRAFGNGDPGAALQAALSRNPLPAITGHVCPAACETYCIRGYTGEPIAIREIKKLVSKAEVPLDTGETRVLSSVAVVGTGPAGLACAAFLSRQGVRVRLYEKSDQVGGVPAKAIPAFRLPASAIDLDVSRILEHPLVELELHSDPLRGLGIGALPAMGFEFAVLATGAGQGRPLRLLGEDLPGVLDGLLFLQSIRRSESVELGNRVLVIGGGSSAVDAARMAKRILGPTGFVEMVYRRGAEHMPAHQEELRLAEQEGVTIRQLCIPLRFEGRNGRVAALRVQGARLEAAQSGRPRPVPIEGSEKLLEATAVIVAIGQAGTAASGIETTADGRIMADEHCRCSIPNVYAIGDAQRGPATIVEAIADAHAASADILGRLGIAPLETKPTLESRLAELLEHKGRSLARRETDLALNGEKEARRCLSCDVLCGLCAIVCPNRANVIYETKPRVLPFKRIEAAVGGPRLVDAGVLRVSQRFQIANLGEPCNACGNCATFCPSGGVPHIDKPRLWLNRKPQGERGIKLRSTATGFVARWESDLGSSTLTKKTKGFRLVCGSFDVRLGLGFEVKSVICGVQDQGRSLDLGTAAKVAVACEGLLESAPYLFSAP